MTMDIPKLPKINRGFLQVSPPAPDEREEFEEDGHDEKKRHPSPVESLEKTIELRDPIDGVSSNKAQTRIVVAGSRGVLKIYRVRDNSIDFVVDMRQGRTRKLSLLYSPSYITWSKLNDDKLASTATTGAVAIWSVEKTKILLNFKSHSRSATVVRWHPTRSNNIISGSKDCSMLLYDIRESTHSMEIKAGMNEAVRDIAFSTKVGQDDIFLSADDGGAVKVWDLRKTSAAVTIFRPHQGYVSSIALNPREPNLVASGGGRDKLIKVWNWNETDSKNGRQRPLFQLETIAPVGRVYWRPDHAWQIASCAVVNDQSILVWDIRRPHLPVVSFAGHKDSVSDLWWSKEHPHRFISVGKDGHIHLHKFAEGDKTLDHLCDAHVDVAPDGLVAVTLNSDNDLRNAPKWERQRATLQMKYDKTSRPSSRQRHAVVVSRRLAMYDPFRGPIHSDLVLGVPDKAEKALKPTLFNQLAKDFMLGEMNLQELCAHNAFVANHRGDERRSQIWRHIGVLFSFTDFQQVYTNEFKQKMAMEQRKWERFVIGHEKDGKHALLPPRKCPEMPLCLLTSNQVRRWRSKRFFKDYAEDPVRFLSTYAERIIDQSIQMKAADIESEEPRCDEFFGLPVEAFSRRRAIVNSIQNGAAFEPEDGWVVQPGREDWEPRKLLRKTLLYLAAQGDIQMCASIATVVGHRLSETISDFQVEIWLRTYIEMLERLELYSSIAGIYKWSWIRRLQQKTTEGTYLKERVGHTRLKKKTEPGFDPINKPKVACTGALIHGRCETCTNPIIPTCVLCDTSIFGQMWSCQRCHHAMHVDHAVTWFRREYTYARTSESSEEEVEAEKKRKITTVQEEDEEDLKNYQNEDGTEPEYCDELFITNDMMQPVPKKRKYKIKNRSNNYCPVVGCQCLCNLEHNDAYDLSLFQRPRKVNPRHTATTRKIADRVDAVKNSTGKTYAAISAYDMGLQEANAGKLDTISTALLAVNKKEGRLLHNAFLASKVVDAPLKESLGAMFDHPKVVESEDEEEMEVDRYYRTRVKQQIELDYWKEKQHADDSDSENVTAAKDEDPPTPVVEEELVYSDESDDEFGNILEFERKREMEFLAGVTVFSEAIYGKGFNKQPSADSTKPPAAPVEVVDESGLRVRRRVVSYFTKHDEPVRKLPQTGPRPIGLVHKSLHEQRIRYGSGGRRRRDRSGVKKYV